MKQTVQQVKRKAPTPAMQKPRNTTYLRPGIVNQSNHSRLANDKWERQADDAAFRIMRGETGVARFLTPVAAASRQVPESRPETLPAHLRNELELGFGADITPIRIHRDAAAANAAKAAESEAFAAGLHIYFGAGHYQPASINGRFLLMHEIAHVVQQTGRPGSQGIRSLADVDGSGNIQRKPTTPEEFDQLSPEQKMTHLRKVHETSDPKLKAKLDVWLPTFVADSSHLGREKWFEYMKNKIDQTTDANELGFILDLVRFFNLELVARAISKNVWVKTIFPNKNVVKHLLTNKTSYKWWIASLNTTYYGKLFWPQGFRDAIEEYIWNPSPRSGIRKNYPEIKSKSGKSTLKAIGRYTESEFRNLDKLHFSEWALAGLYAMQSMERYLHKLFKKIDTERSYISVSKEGEGRTVEADDLYKLQIAKINIIKTKGEIFTGFAGAGDDLFWWAYRDLGKIMVEEADKYGKFSQPVITELGMHGRLVGQLGVLISGVKTHPLNEYIKALPELPDLLKPAAKELAVAASQFFTLNPNAKRSDRYAPVPGKALIYSDLIRSNVIDVYVEKSLSAYKDSQTKTGAEKNKGELKAKALYWFAGWASLYSKNVDLITPKGLSEIETDDRVDKIIVYRYELAREINGIASMLKTSDSNWEKILEIADKVSNAEFIQTSELAIQHPFDVNKKGAIDKIPEDIGASKIKGLEPFNTRDLVYFYETRVMNRYSDILRPLVENREIPLIQENRDIHDLFLIGQADREMEKNLEIRPHRFVSRAAYWIPFASDPVESFASALQQHPTFKALAAQEETKHRELLYRRYGLNEDGSIVIWSIPRPVELIKPLRKIHLLNAVVYLFRSGSTLFELTMKPPESKGGEEQVSEVALTDKVIKKEGKLKETDMTSIDGMPDWEWYKNLTKIRGVTDLLLSATSPADSYIQTIKTQLRTDYQTSRKQNRDLQRKATNLDREVLGRIDSHSITKLLDAFSGSIDTYKYLRAVLRKLEDFKSNIGPADERDMQMSAIMLEHGPLFYSKLRKLNFYYYSSNFYPYISRALLHADKTLAAGNILLGSPVAQQLTHKLGVALLQALKKTMINSLTKHQKKFGIQADAGTQTLTSFLQKSFKIMAGMPKKDDKGKKLKNGPDGPFEIDGVGIHVLQILKSFTFFPRLGTEGPHSLHAPTRLYLGQHIKDPSQPGFTEDASKSGSQPEKLVRLALKYGDEWKEFYITTEHLEDRNNGLAWFTHVITMRATVKNLENLREIIEVFGEGLMFVISLTPVGWAADLAMLIAMIAQAFSDDPEGIKAQLDALFNEPGETFVKLSEQMNKSLNSENLLRVFLLGENQYRDLIKVKPKQRPVRGKSGRKKSVGRALRGVRNLGTSVALQIMQLQGKVQNKTSAVRATIVTRPILAAILQWSANNWHNLTKSEKIILQHEVLGPIFEMLILLKRAGSSTEFNTTLTGHADTFAVKIDDLLKQITELELPEEIVPSEILVSLLLDVFIDFISKRAPGKVKILTRIINEGADFFGAKDILARALAKKMKGTGLDPNTYWVEHFIPILERPFNDGIELLTNEITSLLKQAPILGDLNISALHKPEVKFETNSALNEAFDSAEATALKKEPEATKPTHSPHPAASDISLPHSYERGQIGAGRPLSKELRGKTENTFGHDFGHVRLHTDEAARKRTRSLGADALTCGSHIFMSAGVTPHYGYGEKVFNHELSHVLQKSGPRPLGLNHSSQPVLQYGKNRLRQNKAEEDAADSMAARAISDKHSNPVPVLSLHKDGFSAVSSSAVGKFIRDVSDVKAVEGQYEKIRDKIKPPANLKAAISDLDVKVKKHARALWSGISDNISKGNHLDFTSFWTTRSAKTEALGYIKKAIESASTHGAMTDAVLLLAMNNQTEKTEKVKGSKKKIKTKILDVSSFVRSLELYMLKRTGIPITFRKFDFNPDSLPVLNKRVRDVNIGAIQLRWIDPSLKPWINVIKATWGSETSNKKTKYKKAAKNLIDISHPTRDVWDDNQYKFSTKFKDEVEESVKAKKLSASDLPDWAEFINTTSGRKTVPGVRLSTHKDFTGGSYSLAALDRQSHHTTQFLIAEYFDNRKSFKPFPDTRVWPASIDMSAGRVSKIKKTKTGANSAVNVRGTFEGNRGGAMPAILLSAETHLSAGLHITPRGDEQTSSSQGYTVDSDFNRFMPDEMKQGMDPGKHKLFVNDPKKKAAEKIYFAVQNTYKSVRDDMANKLKQKFPSSEVKYYSDIASGNASGTADDQFTTKTRNVAGSSKSAKLETMKADLKKIANEVTRKTSGHNDKTLLPLGWNADDVS